MRVAWVAVTHVDNPCFQFDDGCLGGVHFLHLREFTNISRMCQDHISFVYGVAWTKCIQLVSEWDGLQ